jgi:hypothetical protein
MLRVDERQRGERADEKVGWSDILEHEGGIVAV